MLQLNFWISELAEKTGVSTRTIRYYIEEGLLPQPEIQGKYAVFNDEYLYRLQLIKYLKDAYLPLKEIKIRLDAINEFDIHGLVKKFEQDPGLALVELDINSSQRDPQNQIQEDAREYISRVMGKNIDQVVASPKYISPAPARPPQSPPLNGESWQRVELIPGIELHYSQRLATKKRSRINELIDFARKIMNRED
jgi:DNA-binding transcriptional MerR regulator